MISMNINLSNIKAHTAVTLRQDISTLIFLRFIESQVSCFVQVLLELLVNQSIFN